jgi:DNA-binding beta-propeller fold protein YncE
LLLAFGVALLRSGASWRLPVDPDRRAHYQPLGYWTAATAHSGPLAQPFGVAAAPSGDIYVTDARQRVVRLDHVGSVVGEFQHDFSDPVGIAVAADRTVYVSDYDLDRVEAFTPDGRFLRAFGTSGAGAGQLNAPAGVAVDRHGFIYVADFYNHRVQKFRPDGSFQSTIGHAGRVGAGALHYPTGVSVMPNDDILVADAYNYQLQWFDPSGKPLRRAGHHALWLWPRPAASSRGFNVPTDAVSSHGVIHVADSANHRVVMLSAAGQYISDWRIPDANPNVYSPEHIAVSPDGSTVYASDLAANRVIVLRVLDR